MFLRSFLCFAVGCQVMFLGLGGALRSAEALDCSGTESWKWVGYHAGKELLLVHQTVEADAENHCPTIHIAEWSLRRNEFVAKHPIVTREEAARVNKLRSMKKHCRRLRASRWLPLSRRLQRAGFVLQPRFSTAPISAKERVSLSGQGQLFFRCKEISDASFEKCDLMQTRGKKQWLIKADFFSRSLSAMRRPAISQVHFTPDKRFLFFLLYRPCRVDRLLSVPSSRLR